jgi:uncharacterized protein YycO
LFLVGIALSGFFLGGLFSVAPTVMTATPGVVSAFAGDGTNTMSSANLLPGDILLIGSDDTIFDYLIPGKWSHTVMFGGWTTAAGQIWGTEEGTWLGSGVPWVIHSTQYGSAMAAGRPSWDDDSGLRTSRFTTVCNQHADNIVALRIVKPGGNIMTVAERTSILSFCTSRLTQPNDYDFNWLARQIEIDTGTEPWLPPFAPNGYYCSELAWAAYNYVLGVDLDGDFSPFGIGVSPEDLYWGEHTSVIALEMNSGAWGEAVPNSNGQGDYKVDASADLYKVTALVSEIYYDSDKEGFWDGTGSPGEMFLNAYVGEGYFPSCASTHQINDVDWDKIDVASSNYRSQGTGALAWNAYHYALISYNSYMKIRIMPMEDDGITSDDAYPAYQFWYAPGSWHGMVNCGWYWSGSRVDCGDCRFTIYFRIDSCF